MRLIGMMTGGTPPGDGEEENVFSRARGPSPEEQRTRKAVLLGLVLLLLVSVWLYVRGGENRALNALSPMQRASLFQETRDSFREMCTGDAGTRRFPKRCAQMAEFLTRFTECDAPCREEIAPALPPPSR
ncbi:hypothetical protein [Corallococcus macrosporus]|uniref:Uncharacterized protein n=1 Tax=Corallococcus macrosporus DSM 14697 TaxID=1189310 RepID=A0A250JMJ9_9BACT|nr:hypothetical protein [Corallococcus macrosporus]ATB44611.1 hypothetical protein MYMAC_000182 [Corallococcus macrosporus DSM 14697]